MMIDREETKRRIDVFYRRGWCPVRWAHHPQPIKDALRAIGLRPQMKACFMNCQRFMLAIRYRRIDLSVTYHEGWAVGIIAFQHAWLMFKGKIVDLTLDYPGHQYLKSIEYTEEQIRAWLARACYYSPVDERALNAIGPYQNGAAIHKVIESLSNIERVDE